MELDKCVVSKLEKLTQEDIECRHRFIKEVSEFLSDIKMPHKIKNINALLEVKRANFVKNNITTKNQ